MYRWGREARGMTQQLTTRISWISAWTSVRSTWLTFYSVLLLRSYCYEHVLWVSCLSLSWRKCVVFFLVFFFSVCFSTFSFHDLKKKKVSTGWAGLKAACLQCDMEPGLWPAKPWCSVLQTHFNNFSKWRVVYFHWNTWRCWINSTFPKLLNKWW